MSKKRKQPSAYGGAGGQGRRSGAGTSAGSGASGASLKDLLSPSVLDQLKTSAEQWKQAEQERLEQKRRAEEEAKRQERKRLENDFEYLLHTSDPNWSKYK
jgi:hypothetical protein